MRHYFDSVGATVRKRRGMRRHARSRPGDLESSVGDEQLQPFVDWLLQRCDDLYEAITNRWMPRVPAGAGWFRKRWRVFLLAALLTRMCPSGVTIKSCPELTVATPAESRVKTPTVG